jgi:hypothetical protein
MQNCLDDLRHGTALLNAKVESMMTAMTPLSWYTGIRIPLAFVRSDDEDSWGERSAQCTSGRGGCRLLLEQVRGGRTICPNGRRFA